MRKSICCNWLPLLASATLLAACEGSSAKPEADAGVDARVLPDVAPLPPDEDFDDDYTPVTGQTVTTLVQTERARYGFEESVVDNYGRPRIPDPEVGRRTLSQRFAGHDFSHLDLDTPLTTKDFPDPDTLETMKSRAAMIVRIVERERLTLRELLARFAGGRGHYTFAGTPEQVADLIEDWFRDGAADGFNVMPPVVPVMLEPIVEHLIPILQKRGLFRTQYEGPTLRDKFGLARPDVRFGA